VHCLAQRVLSHVRRHELLQPGDRVGVAVSGGIDSVALLRLLLELREELGIVLSVVHFNHKLRGVESDKDQEFVASLAHEHGLEFYYESGDVAELAAEGHSGIEAAARELRYEFFRQLLIDDPQGLNPESLVQLIGAAEAAPLQSAVSNQGAVSKPAPANLLDNIATGHTLDDQAETVLMRLIRGTGLRGLGGIYPRLVVEDDDGEGYGEIIRPLLGIRRRELGQYLADLKQPWREDSTNADTKFTRNRVRKMVLPLLEREFNPAVFENLSELAAIARDEEDYWENEVSGWLGTVVQWSEPDWASEATTQRNTTLLQIKPANAQPSTDLQSRIADAPWLVMNASLSRPWLITEPLAVQRRVLKAIGEEAGIPLEFRHIEEILRFAAEESGPTKELSLPLGWKLVREREALIFVTPDLRQEQAVQDYEYPLPVPGSITIPELGEVIEALRLPLHARSAEYNAQQLLKGDLLPDQLTVRNWRPGDRFWPAHTKAPKKVKELLQDRHVQYPEKKLWPVVAGAEGIVWMRGFPVPAKLAATASEEAVLIREVPWETSTKK
jgi:tRNA(Ile)-lysidine synthase